jgi:hypothetical protein
MNRQVDADRLGSLGRPRLRWRKIVLAIERAIRPRIRTGLRRKTALKTELPIAIALKTGSELMTREERREYRSRIRSAETMQQWARFRAEHQQRILARARQENVTLPPPFYGQQLMTDQERERLRERLENAANEQERMRIRNEHREQMQARAREHQIPSSELGD